MVLSLPKPEVILTHESDLDGLLSGLLLKRLAKHLFNQDVPLQAYHNHQWHQRGTPEKSAWVCDLAFEPRLDKQNWVIIDHHATELKPRVATLIHDVTKSASLLSYELCIQHGIDSPSLSRLVRLSNITDLYLETQPEFEEASDYGSLVKSYGFWNLHSLIEGDPERLLDHPLLEVMRVRRKLENPMGYEWSRNHIQEISPLVGLVQVVIGNANAIVNQLLENNVTKHPVLMTLFKKSNSVILASFRSKNGEALAVANQLHGGGHPNAAGATLPRSVNSIPEAIGYLKRILAPTPAEPSHLSLTDLESAFHALEKSK